MNTTVSKADLQKDIHNFIVTNFMFGSDDGSIKAETSFMESGVMDSTGILELIEFLETNYGIEINDSELVPENLDSLENVSAFLIRKSG